MKKQILSKALSQIGACTWHFNGRAAALALPVATGVALATPAHAAPGSAAERDGSIQLLAYGDSLIAGYGLAEADGFTSQLEAALRQDGYDVTVMDGGVSGDTSSGGVSRLDWVLADEPDAVLLSLGANDALRGVDPNETRDNLERMLVRLVKDEGLPTLLAGMMAPPNMGSIFEESFNGIYPDLAEDYDVVFYPFFLDGVAMQSHLNQEDGIHPNSEGVAVIVENILPAVMELLDSVGAGQDETSS